MILRRKKNEKLYGFLVGGLLQTAPNLRQRGATTVIVKTKGGQADQRDAVITEGAKKKNAIVAGAHLGTKDPDEPFLKRKRASDEKGTLGSFVCLEPWKKTCKRFMESPNHPKPLKNRDPTPLKFPRKDDLDNRMVESLSLGVTNVYVSFGSVHSKRAMGERAIDPSR